MAARYGARVVPFPWGDDFAAARNESLRHCTQPWVFWMDADDRLDEPNRLRLQQLIAELPADNVGYIMKCVSPGDPTGTKSTLTEHLRLFRNHAQIRWENRIHETIISAVTRSGGRTQETDLVIQHLGYADPALLQRKAKRNLRLLQLQNAEQPNNAYVLFNLGRTHKVLGQMTEALQAWRQSLAHCPVGAPFLPKLYALLVDGHAQHGDKSVAVALCENGLEQFPDRIDLLFHLGTLLIEQGDHEKGTACMRRVLALPPSQVIDCEEPQLHCKARHNLAAVAFKQGRIAEAEAELRGLLREHPEYTLAWVGLGQVFAAQERWAEAAEAAKHLEADPATATEAASLRQRLPMPKPIATTPPRLTPAAVSELLQQAERALQANNYAEAETAYRRLLDANLSSGYVLYRLGLLVNARGDYEAAWELHRRAVVVEPTLSKLITPPKAPHHGVTIRPSYDVENVTACPVCTGREQRPMMVVNLLPFASYHPDFDPVRRWVCCPQCGHGFANPRPTNAALHRAYRDPAPAHLKQWSYERLVLWSDIVHELWLRRPGGDFLDVGTANGALAGVSIDFGFRAWGLDIHPGYAESVRRLGIDFHQGDFTTYDFGDQRFDVIALGDVIEHLPDPHAAVTQAERLLRPGGIIWLSTPNHEGVWTRALREKDAMWLEGEHLHFFSLRSLRRLLEMHGLAVVDYRLSRRFVGCAEIVAERATLPATR